MKKALFLFTIICLVLAIGTSCLLELEINHTYSSEWSSDDEYHWHAATCEHTDKVSDKNPHSWDNGVVTVEETVNNKEERIYTCTVCKRTKTVIKYEYGTDELIINNIGSQEELNGILDSFGDKYKNVLSIHLDSQNGQTYAISTNDFNANLDLGLLNDIEGTDIVVSLSTEEESISYNELTKEEFLYIYNNLEISSGVVSASQYHSNINENNEGYSITISNITSAKNLSFIKNLFANINEQKKISEELAFIHIYGTIEEFKKQLGLGGGRMIFTDYKTPYQTLQEILGEEFYNTHIPVVEQDGVEYSTVKEDLTD